MDLRIGIDALSIIPGRIAGGETYIYNLVQAIARLDTTNEYVIFVTPRNANRFDHLAPRLSRVVCSVADWGVGWRVLWEQVALQEMARRNRLDLMFFPGNTTWFRPAFNCGTVVTIHDLSHIFYRAFNPESIGLPRWIYLDTAIKRACRVSDAVITDSQHSFNQLCGFSAYALEKMHVVYPGAQLDILGDPLSASQSVSTIDASRPYILSVSTVNKHKNLSTLIDAYALLRNKYSIAHTLVIAGKQGNASIEIQHLIGVSGLEAHIRMMGHVDSSALASLYRNASVFAFPSFYEGFGFPVLEAMLSGCPVVSSNSSSLPELVGDAGILVDPTNAEQLAQGIHAILLDEPLRETLRTRGLLRAREFSWEKTARQTLAVFREAYLNRNNRHHS